MQPALDHGNDSPYLTTKEAALYLRLEESTLNAMRWRQEGPAWRKHGGKVVYHIDDLNLWSRARHSNPSELPAFDRHQDNSRDHKSGDGTRR